VYGYVAGKTGKSLSDYIKNEYTRITPNEQPVRIRALAAQIVQILGILDENRIYHRQLELKDFVFKNRDDDFSAESLILTHFENASFVPANRDADQMENSEFYDKPTSCKTPSLSNFDCFANTQAAVTESPPSLYDDDEPYHSVEERTKRTADKSFKDTVRILSQEVARQKNRIVK